MDWSFALGAFVLGDFVPEGFVLGGLMGGGGPLTWTGDGAAIVGSARNIEK